MSPCVDWYWSYPARHQSPGLPINNKGGAPMAMTSKPIFPGAVLAALICFAMPGTAVRAYDDPGYGCWASVAMQACEASGGRGN
ncbi:MAG: hypothetical protein OXL95_01865, partial [Nitrospira sp.]|nr:hypothetical protein [Nitrospira sp.]